MMADLYHKINNVHKRPLHPGQVTVARALFRDRKTIIQAQLGRNTGKALDVNTPIFTTNGWKTMATLQVGDFVYGDDGRPTCILTKSEVFYNHVCYELEFQDGSKIVADAGHRWKVSTKAARKAASRRRGLWKLKEFPDIFTTEELFGSYLSGKKKEAHCQIEQPAPLEMPERFLLLDPYLLGVWLGDGTSASGGITSDDPEILEEIHRRGYEVGKSQKDKLLYTVYGIVPQLRALGVLNNKHVPREYLNGSVTQRLELLQGLMDTDGTIEKQGLASFCNTRKIIADAVLFLARSLGLRAKICYKRSRCQTGAGCDSWNVFIWPTLPIFKLPRKLARIKPMRSASFRTICSIKKVPSRPTVCISVDNQSHLFLAGEQLIPTHNTEVALYCAWVYALTNPGSQVYIICPQRKQGKEIYWASGRLKYYGPMEYLDGEPKESELRLEFKNHSFICVEGAENYSALRGIKPDLVIYDEFQDHIKEFDVEVMRPNLIAKRASLLVFGTPPKRDGYYYEFKKALLKQIDDGDDTRMYLQLPTATNPTINKEELRKIKENLITQGDEAVWKREYLAEDCIGGAEMVFPLWSRERHVKAHSFLTATLQRQKNECRWAWISDPGSTSTFGCLFIAYNPYTCQYFVLDEIYEQDRRRTDTKSIWDVARLKMKELYTGEWRKISDEAAAWFRHEMSANFSVSIAPTRKRKNKKDDNISLLKMLMAQDDMFFVSDRCKKFMWEIENYVTDDAGNLPDKDDHLIDCMEYSVPALNVKTKEKVRNSEFRPMWLNSDRKSVRVKELPAKDADWGDEAFIDSLSYDPCDF